MFAPCAVNVAVDPSAPFATNEKSASSANPVCTAALHEARLMRSLGGPGARPASAGQMICSLLPAASVASTVPASTGTGTASGPNVSGPPALVTDVVVPASTTLQVPEMTETVGAAEMAQGPMALIHPSGTSPSRSMRSRPVRNWGTVADTRTAAPPKLFTDLHGSEAATASVAVRVTPPSVAVMTTLLAAMAGAVETVNVALVAPPAMFTLAGTPTTAGSALDNVTSAPPAGAAAVSVSVPREPFPATTLPGVRVTDDSAAAAGGGGAGRSVTASVAVRTTPL